MLWVTSAVSLRPTYVSLGNVLEASTAGRTCDKNLFRIAKLYQVIFIYIKYNVFFVVIIQDQVSRFGS